ncbi:MAG: bifunctional oligoribonuclease/PAP phosphatase NrnA [Thermococci archaeon]|nr:bifunctional oligoribonuclease/PAP phosphatase NrnA [Thermococci archaeon]
MKRARFKRLVMENLDRPFLLLCHHNADPDALGSAVALARFLKSKGVRDVRIGVSQSVASYSRGLIDLSPVDVEVNPGLEDEDAVVIVLDTASPEQLEPIRIPRGVPAVLIDHHGSGGWSREFLLSVVDPSRTSTAEIIWDLLKDEDFWERTSCTAILAGIFTDTAGFRFANSETFRVLWEIFSRCRVSMDEVMRLVAPPQDRNTDESRRMAVLKACQRMEIKRVNGYIIAISHVSAYESFACKTFIQLGADVAVVGSSKGNEVRISARAREDLVRKGLNLGKLMEMIGPIIGGSGGGHAGAAGANGTGRLDEAIDFLVERIETFLRNLGD